MRHLQQAGLCRWCCCWWTVTSSESYTREKLQLNHCTGKTYTTGAPIHLCPFCHFLWKSSAFMLGVPLHPVLLHSFQVFMSYTVRIISKYFKCIQAGLEKCKHWTWSGRGNMLEWLRSAVSAWTQRPRRVKDQRASRALSVRASA